MTKRSLFFVFVGVLLIGTIFVHAQNNVLVVDPVTVTVDAADGQTLVGDFYTLSTDPDHEFPAVILIHMLGSNRRTWRRFVPPLLDDRRDGRHPQKGIATGKPTGHVEREPINQLRRFDPLPDPA